jgi:UDP-glucose 4-epimerase
MAVFLVTGGAGFIGLHLAKRLLEQGHEVRILDNARLDSVPGMALPAARLQVIGGDVTDLPLVRQASAGVETVFHLAMPAEWNDPPTQVLTRHAASTGTLHVLIAAREAGVQRVIYASCGSVYGPASPRPLSEDRPPAPASDLAAAKDTGEKDCYAFSYLYGLQTVRLRLFNVYGPRQREGPYARFLAQTVKHALTGQAPELPREGHALTDLLHVDDAVHAFLLAARMPRLSGKAYNIGFGQATSPLRVLETVNRILATAIQPSYSVASPMTEFDNLPDITRAETELGFCPAVGLETGLRNTIDYYLQMAPAPVDLGEPQKKKQKERLPNKEIPKP